MELGDALAWLDGHQNLERMLADTAPGPPRPGPHAPAGRRPRRSPERPSPVIHVTGTNGKTSTARALTQLLMAKGLTRRHLHQSPPGADQRADLPPTASPSATPIWPRC